ncbi:MAG: DUF192 domain-containing protein [Alphaproteobacteria bacterium]|nr:DUF192 domain-containing protein [Alphaproteobacteria bacterium]MBL6939895.1 DUF192 domain-containing protein [Alphaproteobacteria bacterium]MBL7099813.1 DUF192 domain-containing protein [Alphaproteobacteria bacterium]
MKRSDVGQRRAAAVLVLVVVVMLASWSQASPSLTSIAFETAQGLRSFRVEIAADDASRERGLMGRRHLPADGGMLFDFGRPVMTAFWMKDTPLSLDILFVRADGTISTIAARTTPFSLTPIASAEPVRAVVEISGGTAQRLGIGPGSRVRASIFAFDAH